MNRIKIYIIASVSSIFIGVSVFVLVSEIPPLASWAVLMGIAAGLGGMMIELTVPETLVTVWRKSGFIYRTLAVVATITSPALLIWALPGHGLARFAIAFIAASLITYLAFYASEYIKAEETGQVQQQAEVDNWEREKEKLVLLDELEANREKQRAQEERKTQIALERQRQKQGQQQADSSPQAILDYVAQHKGVLSKRELGRVFGISPETAYKRVEDRVIFDNGNGIRVK